MDIVAACGPVATNRAAGGADEGGGPFPASNPDYRAFLESNYQVVRRVVRQIARRRRLTAEDADELTSAVHLKLVEKNYAVLGMFAGRSSLSTYLMRVVDRLYLDAKIAVAGKWRPSVEAVRLGPAAVRLEELLFRDRLSFEQACETLKINFGERLSRPELECIREALPGRSRRPLYCQLDEAGDWPAAPELQGTASPDIEPMLARLSVTMRSLSPTDSRLLRLRFRDGWTVARIARVTGMNQKLLYRRFERIYADLRASVAPSGVGVAAPAQRRRRAVDTREKSASSLRTETAKRTWDGLTPDRSGADVDAITPSRFSSSTTAAAV